jgi:hypothetical protein
VVPLSFYLSKKQCKKLKNNVFLRKCKSVKLRKFMLILNNICEQNQKKYCIEYKKDIHLFSDVLKKFFGLRCLRK